MPTADFKKVSVYPYGIGNAWRPVQLSGVISSGADGRRIGSLRFDAAAGTAAECKDIQPGAIGETQRSACVVMEGGGMTVRFTFPVSGMLQAVKFSEIFLCEINGVGLKVARVYVK